MAEPTPLSETLPALLQVLAANYERASNRRLDSSPISPAEVDLVAALAKRGLHPHLQYPVGSYDADLFFETRRLCVEVDGKQHAKRVERDRTRDHFFVQQRILTVRVPAWIASEGADQVAAEIDRLLVGLHGVDASWATLQRAFRARVERIGKALVMERQTETLRLVPPAEERKTQETDA